jgi:hypothetical protein
MIAIAKVVKGDTPTAPFNAYLLTGNHKGFLRAYTSWYTPLQIDEYILVRYDPEDQFLEPLSLSDVESAFDKWSD